LWRQTKVDDIRNRQNLKKQFKRKEENALPKRGTPMGAMP